MESTVQQDKSESKSILTVLEYCKDQRLPARVVGKWVWIKFDTKPNADVRQGLKSIGFRWSRRREQWCHSCNAGPSRVARNYAPWQRYETTMLEDYVNVGLGVAL